MGRGQVTGGTERCDEEIVFHSKHSRKPLENFMQGRGIRFTIYLFFRFYVFAFMDKSVFNIFLRYMILGKLAVSTLVLPGGGDLLL